MSPSKVRNLARMYAGLTPSEAANHDDWVLRFKAEQAEAEARKAEAERQRAVELLAMSDLDAVRETLRVTCGEYENDAERALQILTLAGFKRVNDAVTLTPVEIRNLLEVSWLDGNGLPERFHDERQTTMREHVDRTIAEIDEWKVRGIGAAFEVDP